MYKDEYTRGVLKLNKEVISKRSVSIDYNVTLNGGRDQVVTFYIPKSRYKITSAIFHTYEYPDKDIPATYNRENNDYVFCVGQFPNRTKIKDVFLCLNITPEQE